MANAYHVPGSTSMAAAAWDDGIGFAQDATLIFDAPHGENQDVNLFCDQSALPQVTSLDFQPTFSGSIGTTANPLKTGAKTRIQNAAMGGILSLMAACIAGTGAANTIALFIQSGTGRTDLLGGTVTEVQQGAGVINVNSSTVVTTVNHSGGTATYEYNATPITTLTAQTGMIILKRQVTTLVNHSALIIYDTVLNCTNFTDGPTAVTDWRGGNIATGNMAGTFTVENATRACTIGSTAFRPWASAKINRNTQAGVAVTFSNETPIAGGPRTAAIGSVVGA